MNRHNQLAIILASVVLTSGCPAANEAAREAARRVKSRNNMKHIVLAVMQYYDERQQWPDGLDELDPLLKKYDEILRNPLTGDNPGYEYVKPSGPLEEINAAETVVLYQLRNGQRDPTLAVAYLDGRVPEP